MITTSTLVYSPYLFYDQLQREINKLIIEKNCVAMN